METITKCREFVDITKTWIDGYGLLDAGTYEVISVQSSNLSLKTIILTDPATKEVLRLSAGYGGDFKVEKLQETILDVKEEPPVEETASDPEGDIGADPDFAVEEAEKGESDGSGT